MGEETPVGDDGDRGRQPLGKGASTRSTVQRQWQGTRSHARNDSGVCELAAGEPGVVSSITCPAYWVLLWLVERVGRRGFLLRCSIAPVALQPGRPRPESTTRPAGSGGHSTSSGLAGPTQWAAHVAAPPRGHGDTSLRGVRSLAIGGAGGAPGGLQAWLRSGGAAQWASSSC